jgi:ribosome-binding protein aMBF1 (putative translation factor)
VIKVEHRSKVYKEKRSSRDTERSGWVLVPGEFATEVMKGRPTRNFAGEYIMWSLGQNLRAARKSAHLTQAQLAQKTRRAQSTVSMAEKGQIRVSTAYVKAALRACGVPLTWSRKDWA